MYRPQVLEYLHSLLPASSWQELELKSLAGRHLRFQTYAPDLKTVIDFRDLQEASEQPGLHLDTALSLRQQGLQLFAFYADEWRDKQELVKAMISYRLRKTFAQTLRASDLQLVKIQGNKVVKPFFAANHLDGHSPCQYAYCLLSGSQVLAALSIRRNHQAETEIARFATDMRYRIHGGAAKLVAAARREIPELITFSNNRLSVGAVYEKLGAALLAENRSSYWYTDGQQRIWRYRCRRINDPEVLNRFPEVPHTEKDQARRGVIGWKLFGDPRPLFRIEDYGHRKWLFRSP